MKKFFVAAIMMVAFSMSNGVSYAQSTTHVELVQNTKKSTTSTIKLEPSSENGDKQTQYTVTMDGAELPIWTNKNGTPFLWRHGKNGGYRYYFRGEQKEQVYKLLGK